MPTHELVKKEKGVIKRGTGRRQSKVLLREKRGGQHVRDGGERRDAHYLKQTPENKERKKNIGYAGVPTNRCYIHYDTHTQVKGRAAWSGVEYPKIKATLCWCV
jgi:hypothetical protein